MDKIFSPIKGRIIKYLKSKGIKKEDFYSEVGIAATNFKGAGAQSELGGDKIVKILTTYSDINPDWLLKGEGDMIRGTDKKRTEKDEPKKDDQDKKFKEYIEKTPPDRPELNEDQATYGLRDIQLVVVTVDTSGRENITLVHVKAQAGYLTHYHDPHFVQELPTFWIPGLRGTLRAFEVEGNSMLTFSGAGLHPGDISIGSYIEYLRDIKDNRVYILVTNTEGIVIKRCFNRLTERNLLICRSDNKTNDYPDIILHAEDIREVWEFKAKFSRQLPGPADAYERINFLEGEVAEMRHLLEQSLRKNTP